MARSKFAKEKAYAVLQQYGLNEPILDDLIYVVKVLGYEIIDFNRCHITDNIAALIKELNLEDLVKSARAFVYRRGEIKLLFIDETMTADEKCYTIAHELGHIVCNHLKRTTLEIVDVQEEFEANEFAHYLLNPGLSVKLKRMFGNRKGHGVLAGIIIALLCVIIALSIFCYRLWKMKEQPVSESGVSISTIDPYNYLDEGNVFGTEINAFLEGKEEGSDYTVGDVYGDKKVQVYTFRQRFEYFGIPEGQTGVRVFSEPDEGITMICYDFLLDSSKPELIVSKLQSMMLSIKEFYGKGYDFGNYYDRQNHQGYINFDDFTNGIRSRQNGTYSVTWVLDEYGVSLDLNYDVNQSVSLGSIRFYLPSKKESFKD